MMRNNSKDFINFGCVKVYKKQNERRFAVSLYKAFTVISSDLLSALAVLFLSPSLPDNIFFGLIHTILKNISSMKILHVMKQYEFQFLSIVASNGDAT